MTLSNDKQANINSPQAYQISLLEEKLQIARRKQKVGEVIVRKVVETKVVTIPIRREKLIVERIGNNPEILTEVVISEEKVNGFKYDELDDHDTFNISKSHFISFSEAQKLLADIEQLSLVASSKVRLEIVSSCGEDQEAIQDICDRNQ